jgi:hypothetical protein
MVPSSPRQSSSGPGTALFLAVTGGHTDCVRLLVEAGADLDFQDKVRSG